MKIRLNKTDNVNSVNTDNITELNLDRTAKVLPYSEVIDTVNLYSQFEKERNSSDKYRFSFTINPVCSNVLFNVLTEIVYKEGSITTVFVENNKTIDTKNVTGTEPIGKNVVNRYDMIRNTEYNNESMSFVYHCGYDIFNNHLLRTKNFKNVNPLSGTSGRNDFNTLTDTLRYSDGQEVKFTKRFNIDSAQTNITKHLYDYDDILSFTDTINENLIEENGWFGFTNKMQIDSRKYLTTATDGSIFGNSLDINKIININKPCEFIDMYPDRSLYYFNPKYNKERKRLEYNWHVCLTYPYDVSYKHETINGNGVNGILCFSIEKNIGLTGEDIYLFRTSISHGLKPGDTFMLYYSKGNILMTDNDPLEMTVKDTGDLDGKYKKQFFYCADYNILDELSINDDDNVNEHLKEYHFRIKKLIGEIQSSYYMRLFKKIPNLKRKTENLTYDVASDKEKMEDYIRRNALSDDGKTMLPFSNEIYQLGFASNIYTDKQTEVLFTDKVDITNLCDAFGKPVTEVYLTVVKNNAGYKEWYSSDVERRKDTVEFSHCFGKVSSGFNLLNLKSDKYSTNEYDLLYSDVHKIHNINNSAFAASSKVLEDDISINGSKKWYWEDSPTEHTDIFIGDLVEYNVAEVKETILEEVHHRFNTAQRELVNPAWSTLKWEEIATDDYDNDPFKTNELTVSDCNLRPEGYYYKSHHRVAVKELSKNIQQESVLTLSVTDAVRNTDKTVLVTVSSFHNTYEEDLLTLCEINNKFKVVGECKQLCVRKIVTKSSFIIDLPSGYTMTTFCNQLKEIKNKNNDTFNGCLVLRKPNYIIPTYADEVNDGSGRFLWRETNNVGNIDNVQLEEYPFTNGCFYVEKHIDFFVRRQDSFGYNGLLHKDFPNDVVGKKKKENFYEYVDVNEVLC